MLSRAFFFPGALPPFTHLGCTIFRHGFHSAWRYARYHLGCPVPDSDPIRFVHLRPYFQGNLHDPLDDLVLRPGSDDRTSLNRRTVSALWFHRQRMHLRSSEPPALIAANESSDSWQQLRANLTSWVPVFGDALIQDLGAVHRRRMARADGQPIEACSSPETQHWVESSLLPSSDVGAEPCFWSSSMEAQIKIDPPRGAFRDAWLSATPILHQQVAELGQQASDRCHLDDPSSVWFLPFDHLDLLVADQAVSWIGEATAKNRAEWLGLADSEAPAEMLENSTVGLRLGRPQAELAPCALSPLV